MAITWLSVEQRLLRRAAVWPCWVVRDTFDRIVIYHRGAYPDADGAHIDLVILAIGGGSRMLRIARQTGEWVEQEHYS